MSNVNHLGNLTVSHYNQKLSNQRFEHKKPICKQSSIEHEFQHYRRWNLKVVKQREGEIIDFVLNRWKA